MGSAVMRKLETGDLLGCWNGNHGMDRLFWHLFCLFCNSSYMASEDFPVKKPRCIWFEISLIEEYIYIYVYIHPVLVIITIMIIMYIYTHIYI